MTPRLRVVKFDTRSGLPDGDRNSPEEALTVHGDTDITARVYNDSGTDPDTGTGYVFLGKDLHLEDATIAGDGQVVDWRYPDGWDSYVLRPGKYVDIHGTLKGVTDHHTDRAKVTGRPLAPCVVPDTKPFDPEDPVDGRAAAPGPAAAGRDSVMVDGVAMCGDTTVESNQDDWNGKVEHLAITGSAVTWMLLAGMVLLAAGLLLVRTIRRDAQGRAYLYTHVAQPALAHALGEDQDGADGRRDELPR